MTKLLHRVLIWAFWGEGLETAKRDRGMLCEERWGNIGVGVV